MNQVLPQLYLLRKLMIYLMARPSRARPGDDLFAGEKFKNSPLVAAHPSRALIKWLLAESLRTGGVIAHSSSHEVQSSVAPTL